MPKKVRYSRQSQIGRRKKKRQSISSSGEIKEDTTVADGTQEISDGLVDHEGTTNESGDVDSPSTDIQNKSRQDFDSASQMSSSEEIVASTLEVTRERTGVHQERSKNVVIDSGTSETSQQSISTLLTAPKELVMANALVGSMSRLCIEKGQKSTQTYQGGYPWDMLIFKVNVFLPKGWSTHFEPISMGLDVVYHSKKANLSVQRSVHVSGNGDVSLFVHSRQLPSEHVLWDCIPRLEPLIESNVNSHCDVICNIVHTMSKWVICCGANQENFREFWSDSDRFYIDKYNCGDSRFSETCRAVSCLMLVSHKHTRCDACSKVLDSFKKKYQRRSGERSEFTSNAYLSRDELLAKLSNITSKLEACRKMVRRLREKVQLSLAKDGIRVDKALHQDMTAIMRGCKGKLSTLQKLFFEEQVKAANLSSNKGMRWHPVILRFALHLQSISPSCYEALRNTGMIKLPSTRTLFDYSSTAKPSQGVDMVALKDLHDQVMKSEYPYQAYHVLMFDEMHISKNIVFKKHSGDIVGFVSLSEVDTEMRALVKEITEESQTAFHEPVASKMLAYMVKGCSSSVKEVVASYATDVLTKDDLYEKTWHVIGCLEKVGVKILAVICDGAAVNRAFFQMHAPATKTKSGVVYSTVNLFAPDRLLFFFSDTPHLLKTIRNALCSSGNKNKKRLLMKNSQTLQWSTLIRLYNVQLSNPLKKCYKLNKQNIFLNSYSCMKVAYAAQVMSRSVAEALTMRQWPGTEELIKFLYIVNDWFDCLNGAHSKQSRRKRNPLLAKYVSENDVRFSFLEYVLSYLEEWDKEVDSLDIPKSEKVNKKLPYETVEGIEITTRSFIEAVRFLLKEAKQSFVMGRIFCQDPLEQFFSKQRARLGGIRNPTVDQFLQGQGMIHLKRGLGFCKRSGNTEWLDEDLHPRIFEPLRKRKKQLK